MATSSLKDLLPILSPWTTCSFDPESPVLGGLTDCNKVAVFQKTVFADLLLPMLYKGEETVMQVIALCRTALELYEDVDLLERSAAETQAHDEACCVWRSLLSLVGTAADDSQESASN